MGGFRSANVCQLLHNKFVVVLGDSIQRSVYKDLVKLLQSDEFLSEDQLRDKGEKQFENDSLIEGGQLSEMTNETTFREVRQYRSGHHLVRFYFLTRVYSEYLESILSDFQRGPQPDVLIASSCVWDLNRYNDKQLEGYKTNLDRLFLRLKEVLSPQCLIIWNMTMPVGYRDYDASFQNIPHNLRMDIVEANFFSAMLADFHGLDVLDMHFFFRYDLKLRCHDAIHWNQLAHRKYSQILLSHIALAWGLKLPKAKKPKGSPLLPSLQQFSMENNPHPVLFPPVQERCGPGPSPLGNISPLMCGNMAPSYFTPPSCNDPGVRDYGGIYRGPPPFGNESPFLCANMDPSYFTPPPCNDPAVRDHGGTYRGSPLLPTPPRRLSLGNDPHPMLYPPIQERERCGPGSPLLPPSPHRFSLGNDPHPMLYPPIQERERCDPGSPLLPASSHQFTLGDDPHPMLYPPIQERERRGPAPPPLGTGSPFMPPDSFPLPPGPDFTHLPFFSMMAAAMTFASFPPCAPLPREAWEMNMQPRKALNSRRVRSHSYHSLADHPYHPGSNDFH